MKKAFLLSVAIMLSLALLAGCGKKENDDTAKEEKEQASNEDKSSEEDEKASNEEPNSILNDNSSYFVIIDGKKFSAGDKIADVSSVGYSLSSDVLEEELPGNKYMIGAGYMENSEGDDIFQLTPFNVSDSSITIADSVIGGLDLKYAWAKKDEKSADFEVYGGIKLGSSEEEVKKVFGEPSSTNEVEASLEGEPNSVYYTYDSDEVYREYEFVFQDGKVTDIKWQNLVFNEK